ncbi:hypothetical protein [Pararhizobium sp.]|uniref:hypothetical protein n=1 Tax=Pararhizobium sp. TaxID=1977563 RepID=UPI00271B49B1|nr:hypothetical protein [Pararhizobium sp.]MDO9417001.1 hypothetical protein [Pararhizobium sp.]
MTWNHDMTAVPLGRMETVTKTIKGTEHQISEYHVAPVWLACADGSVCRSYWIPAVGKRNGRWSGWAEKSLPPIAWQPYVVPVHPSELADGGAGIVTRHSEINLPIIDDVGGQ